MSKITFFNRCYWPDSEATGQLLTELAEFLAAKNHEVEVVVGLPNFQDESVSSEAIVAPARNGVAIHRLQHSQVPKHKKFGRIRNLVSFTLAVRKWLKNRSRKNSEGMDRGERREWQERQSQPSSTVLERSAEESSTVWICETDPFLLPLVVGPAARRSSARLFYYLQDIYPDVAVALGVTKNSAPIRLLRNRLKREYERAEKIIVLDEDMKSRLVDWGLDANRIVIVPNWMDCSLVQPNKQNNSLRTKWNVKDNELLVMHSGNMGMTQRLEVLIDAFQSAAIPDESRLFLVGNGAKRPMLESLAADQGNVTFLGYQPKELLGESLSAADLHVVSMDANITGCLAPSKLYGILAAATPVLAIVPKGNAVWKLVQEHELGWCAEPGDIPAIIRAICTAKELGREQLRSIGLRGRELAIKYYDRQVCCSQFEHSLA